MGYNRENYERIRREYENKNVNAKEAARARAQALHADHPELKKIDDKLAETGFAILRESTKGREGLEERLMTLRETNKALQEARAAYLESIGYPADYTAVKYECKLCADTGFVGLKMCQCMRRALVMAGYESSGIGKLMQTQRFDTFNLDCFTDPREHSIMTAVYNHCKNYAETFSETTKQSLLFVGGTGRGKTHLSTAVAKTVIERGFDVVYDTTQNILADFEYERFLRGYSDNSKVRTDKYFDCDLLIMDDLGAEIANQFTVACVYNIINTRINGGKPTIVSTNLSQKEMSERFGERIVSRLYGEYMAFRFVGKDVRLERAFKNT